MISAVVLLFGVAVLGARASPEQPPPNVVLVTGFCNEANLICRPFGRAIRRIGARGRVVSPDPREDPIANFSVLAKQSYDVIFVDLHWIDVLGQVAPKFPKERFVLLEGPLSVIPGSPRNVTGIMLRTHAASYLAGWLAARLERGRAGKDVVGAVGGARVPSVDDFIIGYRAGAKRGSPRITVLTDYSEHFDDRTKCEAIARGQVARGAGVVFSVAGACGLGALEAARDGGAWGIGVDADQSGLGSHILTSVVKDFEAVVVALLKDARAGRLRTGVTREFNLRQGGSKLGQINRRVPASLRAELRRLRARIVAGEVSVPGAR